MASKTNKVPPKGAAAKNDSVPNAAPAIGPGTPLLDLNDAAVKKMIKQANKRGYVSHDELNAVLPSEEVSSDRIEDIYAMLNEMGINVVSAEEGEQEEKKSTAEGAGDDEDNDTDTELVEVKAKPLAKSAAKEPSERTDDPVRLYLREMGTVELLSREGEIAIAKRIEAGREAMIAGLCESPLTFQAIIIWRNELNNGKAFLRDIIDLEATYAGPDAKNNIVPGVPGVPSRQTPPPGVVASNVMPFAAVGGGQPIAPLASLAAPSPQAAPGSGEAVEAAKDSETPPAEGDYDEDDVENSISLAAIEAELKPKVLEIFDTVASEYKRLRRLQDQDIAFQLKNQSLSPAQERKYKKIKEEIIAAVKSLRLGQRNPLSVWLAYSWRFACRVRRTRRSQ